MYSARTYHTDEELNAQQVKNLFDQLKSLQKNPYSFPIMFDE